MRRIRGGARRLLLVSAIAGGAFMLLVGFGGAAQAEQYGIYADDPEPNDGIIASNFDVRQDEYITLGALLCIDDGIFDLCSDQISEIEYDLSGNFKVQISLDGGSSVFSEDNNGGSGYSAGNVEPCTRPDGTEGVGVATYCRYMFKFPAGSNSVPAGEHSVSARICAVGGSPCSPWDNWTILAIEYDWDVQSAPGMDNDGDLIPCEFENNELDGFFGPEQADNDARYQRDTLQCVNSDGVAGITELGLFSDFAVATVRNFCRGTFFGTIPIYNGAVAFVDVTVLSGTVEVAMTNLFTQKGFVTIDDGDRTEAYVIGNGICTVPNAPNFFGFDVGFCKYKTMMQEDKGFLGFDEIQMRISGRGFFGTSFRTDYGFDGEGNRDPEATLLGSFEVTPA